MGLNVVELQEIIKNAAYEGAKRGINENYRKCKTETNFQKTEKMLYNYNTLKSVEQIILEDCENISIKGKSKDIVIFSTNGCKDDRMPCEIEKELRAKRLDDLKRVKVRIALIEKAFQSVKNNIGYYLIQEYYFDGHSVEDIAKKRKYNLRTVYKHKTNIVNTLSIFLFGPENL